MLYEKKSFIVRAYCNEIDGKQERCLDTNLLFYVMDMTGHNVKFYTSQQINLCDVTWSKMATFSAISIKRS